MARTKTTVAGVVVAAFGLGVMVVSSVCAADETRERAGDSGENLEDNTPILELRWGRSNKFWQVNTELVKQVGANRLWYGIGWVKQPTEVLRREFAMVNEAGMPVTRGVGSKHPEKFVKENPELRTQHWRYEPSRPVTAEDDSAVIKLFEAYGDNNGFNAYEHAKLDIDVSQDWCVVDLTTNEVLSPDAWSYDEADQTVTVEDAVNEHKYRVFYLKGSGKENPSGTLNLLNPKVYNSEKYWNARHSDPSMGGTISFARPVSVVFGGWNLKSEKGVQRDWYGAFSYARAITSDVFKGFEEKTGQRLDPRWFIHNGRLATSDDPPTEGALRWMSYVNERIIPYGRVYTDWLHGHGVEAVFFWGDGWIGIEPYKGMLGEMGYDEVTLPTNSALDARRVTDFKDPDVRRCIRIWVHSAGAIRSRWRRVLQTIIRKMPDGVSMGSQNAQYMNKKPGWNEALSRVYGDFERIHDAVDGTKAYTNDVTAYVVNAWGNLRAWPRAAFSANKSQFALQALVDLPIEIKWISLREIEDGGVPEDADVLLNIGEPGSSWAGGFHWNEEVASEIREFVDAGGGLLGVDGTALNEDKFFLSDVYGLEYEGRVAKAAENEIYRGSATMFLDSHSSPRVKLSMKEDAPRFFAGLDDLGKVATHIAVSPSSDKTEVLAEGQGKEGRKALATVHPYGEGKAGYVTGNGTWMVGGNPPYEEFLKRMVYAVAETPGTELMQELDSPTPGGHVYFYPEADMLFVYNRAAESNEIYVHASAVAEHYDGEVMLRPYYHGGEKEPRLIERRTCAISDLKQGIRIQVPEHDYKIFKLYRPYEEE